MTLQELITSYLTERNLSQRQFATQCGLSNGYISMIVRGENPKTHQPIMPTLPKLKQLASGMGISLSELFTSVDDMPIDFVPDTEKNPTPDIEDGKYMEFMRLFKQLPESEQQIVIDLIKSLLKERE